LTPNHSYNSAIPRPQEGRIAIVTDVGCGERWPRSAGRASRFSQGGLYACERRPRADERRGRGRQSRVVLAPVAGVKPAEDASTQPGFDNPSIRRRWRQKEIRLQGERGISRQTTAQGMPGCSGCTCMLVCESHYILHPRPRAPAGARHSLRPLVFGGTRFMQTSGAARCEMAKVYPRHCEERSDEAIHARLACGKMDCFASLAMTTSRFGIIRNKSLLLMNGNCASACRL
jgi:hypothetical protein